MELYRKDNRKIEMVLNIISIYEKKVFSSSTEEKAFFCEHFQKECSLCPVGRFLRDFCSICVMYDQYCREEGLTPLCREASVTCEKVLSRNCFVLFLDDILWHHDRI